MAPPATSTSPFRLLILTPSPKSKSASSLIPSLLEELTGTRPRVDLVSFAGYTEHEPLRLSTKYYVADVSIWCDEVPVAVKGNEEANHDDGLLPTTPKPSSASSKHEANLDEIPTLAAWRSQMLSDTAKEVRLVIGGILLALPVESATYKTGLSEDYLDVVEAVNDLRAIIEEEGYDREVAAVILLQGLPSNEVDIDSVTEKVEETLLTDRGILGWDVVGWNGEASATKTSSTFTTSYAGGQNQDSRNAYGEKVGIARVREVLEAIDWSGSNAEAGDLNLDLGFLSSDEADDDGTDGIKLQGQELEREMMSLKLAMMKQDRESEGDEEQQQQQGADGSDETKVEQLPVLLERVVAIREAGAEMTLNEREKFAKREIGRIMKEMR